MLCRKEPLSFPSVLSLLPRCKDAFSAVLIVLSFLKVSFASWGFSPLWEISEKAVGLSVCYPPTNCPHPLTGHSNREEEQVLRANSSPDLGSDLPLDLSPDDSLEDSNPVSPNEDLKLCAEQMMQMATLLEIEVTSNITADLYAESPGIVAFPIQEGIASISKAIW